MTARAFVDPRREMALFHRILIGTAAFFFLLLIGIQVTRATGVASPGATGGAVSSTVSGR